MARQPGSAYVVLSNATVARMVRAGNGPDKMDQSNRSLIAGRRRRPARPAGRAGRAARASAPGWTGRSAWSRRRCGATASPSMCGTRSCTTGPWSRSWRRRAPCSSRSWTRCRPTRTWCSRRMACRRRSRPRRSGGTSCIWMPPARLVSKVHREAERHFAGGGAEQRHILMIGHAGHPEVVGTMGQLPPGSMTLVQSVHDAETVEVADPAMLAFITQTTLSVDDTADIVATLAAALPADRGAQARGHLLRDHKPPGGGEGGGAGLRPGGGDRQPEQQQLAAAAGSGRAGRGEQGDPAAAGQHLGLGGDAGRAHLGADGRRVGAGKPGARTAAACWASATRW